MKLTIIYRDNSDHSRAVTDFVEMLKRRYPDKEAELLDLDTIAGAEKAKVYGVTRYPALLLTTYDGQLFSQWEGEPLPLLDEVGPQIQDERSAPTV